MTKAQTLKERIALLRSDPSKTEARYDEIVRLRMLLLDVLDDYDDGNVPGTTWTPVRNTLLRRIERDAKRYGKDGDCV